MSTVDCIKTRSTARVKCCLSQHLKVPLSGCDEKVRSGALGGNRKTSESVTQKDGKEEAKWFLPGIRPTACMRGFRKRGEAGADGRCAHSMYGFLIAVNMLRSRW